MLKEIGIDARILYHVSRSGKGWAINELTGQNPTDIGLSISLQMDITPLKIS